MKITLILFAVARELIGQTEVELEVNSDATVQSVKEALVEHHPELKEIVATSVFSVDQEFVRDNFKVSSKSEIALIPPVSGG